MTNGYFDGSSAAGQPYSSGDTIRALSRLNMARFYVTIFAIPALLLTLGALAWVNADASRPVVTVEATATESSRPLGGDDKAPADWTGDGVADGWLFGEWLPGQSGNVYLLDGEQTHEPLTLWYYIPLLFLYLCCVALFFLFIGLFVAPLVERRARSEASSDYHFAYLSKRDASRGGLFRPRRLSRVAGEEANRALLSLFAFHPSSRVASAALGNPRTPSWVLRLALVRGGRLLCSIAGNPSSSPAALKGVAVRSRSSHLVLQALVRNPNSPAGALDVAVSACQEGKISLPSVYPEIISAVICHPRCSESTAIGLLETTVNCDRYYDLSRSHITIASSASAPTAVLSWLAHNSTDSRVLRAVLRNPGTPAEDAAFAALIAQPAGMNG